MSKTVHIEPLGTWARRADTLLTPIMYLAAGTFRESPQRTHAWNNRELTPKEARRLDLSEHYCVTGEADPNASPRWKWGFIPLFHLPIFGGWRKYLVLTPSDFKYEKEWHLGWHTKSLTGVSRIPVRPYVRALLGNEPVTFFGIDAETGYQIPLMRWGDGAVGDGGVFRNAPLV